MYHKERFLFCKLTSYVLDPVVCIADTLGREIVFCVKFGSSSQISFTFVIGFLLLEEAQTGRSLWVKGGGRTNAVIQPEVIEDKRRQLNGGGLHQVNIMSFPPSHILLPGFPLAQSSIKYIAAQKSHLDWNICDKIPLLVAWKEECVILKCNTKDRGVGLNAETAVGHSSGRFHKPLSCPSPWRLLKRPEYVASSKWCYLKWKWKRLQITLLHKLRISYSMSDGRFRC